MEKEMTDEDIVLIALKKTESKLLGLNRYMSVNTFEAHVIFSHDFAKAFWGEKEFYTETGKIWYDGEVIANNFEELQLSINKLSNSQLKQLKEFGSVAVSSYSTFDVWNYKYVGDWEFHLQQMVLCKKPLKYLEKFL